LPGLAISSEELYQRLKRRGVLVISGHYFFPGLKEDWQHKHECLRITYSMNDEVVHTGHHKMAWFYFVLCFCPKLNK